MATTKTPKAVPKISVKIWRPIIDKLDTKLEAQCLRRDAYLAKVLEVELDHLDAEVSIPNSQSSYNYVADQLDRLDRKLVSLALPPALTQRLNEICGRKRIVRDAFFNRLFLLLAASPKAIDSLLFDGDAKGWRAEVWSEFKHEDPFFNNTFYPLAEGIDPFWAIRIGLEMYAERGGLVDYLEPTSATIVRVSRGLKEEVSPPHSLYTALFDQKVNGRELLGLNCFMPDWLIPGQEAEREHRAMLDEMLAELAGP